MRSILSIAILLITASAAAAQSGITFSGEARFGVTYDDSASRKADGYGLLDLDPVARVTLDNGLIIGAQTRIRAENGEAGGISPPRFFITTGRPQPLPRR